MSRCQVTNDHIILINGHYQRQTSHTCVSCSCSIMSPSQAVCVPGLTDRCSTHCLLNKEGKDLDNREGGKKINKSVHQSASGCTCFYFFRFSKARQRLHKMLRVNNRGNTPSKIGVPEGACVPFCPFGSCRLRRVGMSAGQRRASQAGRAGSLNG